MLGHRPLLCGVNNQNIETGESLGILDRQGNKLRNEVMSFRRTYLRSDGADLGNGSGWGTAARSPWIRKD